MNHVKLQTRFAPAGLMVIGYTCYFLFLLLTADVYWHGPFSKLDGWFSSMCHRFGTQHFLFFAWVTEFGDPEFLRKLTWGTVAFLIVWGRWYHIPGLLVAVFVGFEINSHLQEFLSRVRPQFDDLPTLTHYGFPSGHTAGAVLFFGYLSAIIIGEFVSKRLKVFLAAFLLTVAFLVGVSRVGLLVHFVGDVIGAILWSTCWILFCYFGSAAACRKSFERLMTWARIQPESASGSTSTSS